MRVASEDKAPSHVGIEATWGALSGYTSIHALEQLHVSDGQRMFYKVSLVIIFSFYEHNTQLSLCVSLSLSLSNYNTNG